ncbi:MAG: ABC transporter ATP-binding protein [Planctomycetota bacterium]
MSVLAFQNIHRTYRAGEEVLSGVSLSIEEGEVVGLLGRNGAGKTTLIHIALGMIRAQEGMVRVFGLDPEKDPVAIKRRVGFVSENQILPPAMKVSGILEMHRELFPTWDREFERALRQRFSFSEKTRVKALSKGQARQLALLCAVAHRPELLLLDEPAGGLDPAARRSFLEAAIQLLSESGTAILFSSHHMADVERMAARVVLLEDRRVLIDRDLDELRENSVLAILPAGADASAVAGLPGCVRARTHEGAVRAVFAGSPDAVALQLHDRLGGREVHCQHVQLEDLFVELVGADS